MAEYSTRSDKARERTETQSGALLTGLTALETFAVSRVDLVSIDTARYYRLNKRLQTTSGGDTC